MHAVCCSPHTLHALGGEPDCLAKTVPLFASISASIIVIRILLSFGLVRWFRSHWRRQRDIADFGIGRIAMRSNRVVLPGSAHKAIRPRDKVLSYPVKIQMPSR